MFYYLISYKFLLIRELINNVNLNWQLFVKNNIAIYRDLNYRVIWICNFNNVVIILSDFFSVLFPTCANVVRIITTAQQ